MHILAIEEKITALEESGAVCGVASRSTTTVKAGTINRETLELSALAGALGAATRARVGPLLATAILGKPTELVDERICGSRSLRAIDPVMALLGRTRCFVRTLPGAKSQCRSLSTSARHIA